MNASRTAVRSARIISQRRFPQVARQQIRRYADAAPSTTGASSGAITGGLVGGAAALGVGYAAYHFSGARSTVNSISSTKQYFQNQLDEATKYAPEPNQAIQWLRSTVTSYAGIIPGAKQYIDSTFDELDDIQKKHGSEVDKIVKDSYNEMKGVVKKEGASAQGLVQVYKILEDAASKIKDLAKDVGKDLLKKNPQLEEQFGGQFKQLKDMGEQYGPEAKKQVDETYDQIKKIIAGGVGVGSINELRKLVQDKVQQVQKLGDEAYNKGLEQIKPQLEKAPKVKEFVEKNKDKLKSGNLNELWEMVKSAVQSGDTKDLEKYVKDNASKAANQFGGSQLEQYMKFIPGGSDIASKFQELKQLSEKHGEKAEQLLKETFEDVKKVLEKKVDQGKKIADEAKKDAS